MAGDAIRRSGKAQDIMDDLSTAVYQAFLEKTDGLGVSVEGELQETTASQSGEVSFGQVCISGTKRVSLHWARAVYRDGALRSFTYAAPEDPEGYYPTLRIVPSADGYQVYREAVKTDREHALIVRPLAKFAISPTIAKRVATFVTYACKEDQVCVSTDEFDIAEVIRIVGDPVSTLSNPPEVLNQAATADARQNTDPPSRFDRMRAILRDRQLRRWRKLYF